jgi:hypothetical protein
MGNVYGPFGDFGPTNPYPGGSDDITLWQYLFGSTQERLGETLAHPTMRGTLPYVAVVTAGLGLAGYVTYSLASHGRRSYLPVVNASQQVQLESGPEALGLSETSV